MVSSIWRGAGLLGGYVVLPLALWYPPRTTQSTYYGSRAEVQYASALLLFLDDILAFVVLSKMRYYWAVTSGFSQYFRPRLYIIRIGTAVVACDLNGFCINPNIILPDVIQGDVVRSDITEQRGCGLTRGNGDGIVVIACQIRAFIIGVEHPIWVQVSQLTDISTAVV